MLNTPDHPAPLGDAPRARRKRPLVTDSNATLLRMCDVQARTGLSRTTIYALIGASDFPPPVKVKGMKASRWVSTEVAEFIADTIEASRSTA